MNREFSNLNFNPAEHEQEKQRVANELLNIDIEVIWGKDGKDLRISIPYEDNEGTTYGTELSGHIEKLENENIADTENDTFFYIDDIRVHPMARRRGIGLLILEKLYAELKKVGIKNIFGVAEGGEALGLFAKAFGKQNMIFYKSEYKPTEIYRYGEDTDEYSDLGHFDFGVDLSKIEKKNEKVQDIHNDLPNT
jgi:GNAT superfamily N-acetyltransferase